MQVAFSDSLPTESMYSEGAYQFTGKVINSSGVYIKVLKLFDLTFIRSHENVTQVGGF